MTRRAWLCCADDRADRLLNHGNRYIASLNDRLDYLVNNRLDDLVDNWNDFDGGCAWRARRGTADGSA